MEILFISWFTAPSLKPLIYQNENLLYFRDCRPGRFVYCLHLIPDTSYLVPQTSQSNNCF